MGYRYEPPAYRLRFEDHPGLEITARSVSISEYLQVTSLADQMTSNPGKEQIAELFGWFAQRLVAWNLEDGDGKPLPAAVASLMSLDLPFAVKIVLSWVQAVAGVSAPLPNASRSGATPQASSLEASLLEASAPVTPPISGPAN